VAVVYGVMRLLPFWVQNIIYSAIVCGLGVFLLIFIAIGVDEAFRDIDENNTILKSEIETLRKEIDELKDNRKTQNNHN
jgi:hypothetical protein